MTTRLGSIYKIVHSQSDICYVGSTFNTLRQRFAAHKAINSTTTIGKLIRQYGKEQFKIILIKQYEVCDRKHLEAYEQLWINKLKCVNHNDTIRLFKQKYYRDYMTQYRKDNEEKVKKVAARYYQTHKKYVFCQTCNKNIVSSYAEKHKTCPRHLRLLDNSNVHYEEATA